MLRRWPTSSSRKTAATRGPHLFYLRSPAWGLAWACKILTDPFHNIAIYWKSPLCLMRG